MQNVTETLEVLFCQKPLTKAAWEQIIGLRCAALQPHMAEFTHSTLKDFLEGHMMQGGRIMEYYNREALNHLCAANKDATNLRAIFYFPNTPVAPAKGGGVGLRAFRIYGLQTNGYWVGVTVYFHDELWTPQSRTHVDQLMIQRISPTTLIAELSEPKQLWDYLGSYAKTWRKSAKEKYNELRLLDTVFTIEDKSYQQAYPQFVGDNQ